MPWHQTAYKFAPLITGSNDYKLSLYSSSVQAGFPSPAGDHLEKKLDLNEHLIDHPAATFAA
jgi:DNA polymerase V